MKFGPVVLILAGTVGLGGCAHTPPVTLTYYAATTSIDFTVTRSLACDNDNFVYSVQDVKASVVNRANLNSSKTLELGKLNSALADTSFEAGFYDDGRLKSINSVATGKAGDIVKSAVKVIEGLALPISGLDGTNEKTRLPVLCKVIAETNPKDKVVTLKYTGTITPSGVNKDKPIPLSLVPESALFLAKVIGLEGGTGKEGAEVLKVTVTQGASVAASIAGTGGTESTTSVRVIQPALVDFTMKAGVDDVWDDTLPIAQLGTTAWLPISKAPAFGKNVTEMEFAESGALKRVKYGADTGATAALDSLNEAIDLANGPSAAEQAKAYTDEINRIKAEQKLAICLADASKCE